MVLVACVNDSVSSCLIPVCFAKIKWKLLFAVIFFWRALHVCVLFDLCHYVSNLCLLQCS